MQKVLRNHPETSLPPFGWQNTAKGRASQSTECPSIAEDIINLKFIAAFSTDLIAIFNEERSLLLRKLFSEPLCMRGRLPRAKCNR